MVTDKLRRRIAHEAARLMYVRQEWEYYRAKMKAARRICGGLVQPKDLPSNREIRDEIQLFARQYEGDRRIENLREMRIEALRVMRILKGFRPRLVGSTLSGNLREGSGIDIHVFSDRLEAITAVLEQDRIPYEVERRQVSHNGQGDVVTQIHVAERYPIELTIYPTEQVQVAPRSPKSGEPIERVSIDQLRQLLRREYPDMSLDGVLYEAEHKLDRFQVYEMLLRPLEQVKQDRKKHPEGDVLYHSLQVFELARDELPYDEEFLLAALLHDVGKAIDPREHVRAGLEALDGFITPRTAWFIEHHSDAGSIRDGTLGARSRRRLESSEDFEELMLLCDCDRKGRERGVAVPDVQESLAYLRDLARANGE